MSTDETTSRHTRHRQLRQVSWTWLLLAVIVSIALSVAACSLLLPDRAPALLSDATPIRQAPISIQSYSGRHQVTLMAAMTAKTTLTGNASGIVTADYSGTDLKSGRPALRVNDRAVIALHTVIPLYRDLSIGDNGDDVLALNTELNRLGYRSTPGSSNYSAQTKLGWRQVMIEAGNPSDGSLHLADILWIPTQTASVSSWNGVIGSTLSPSSSWGEVPGTLTRLTVKNATPADTDQTLSLFGLTTTLKAGSTSVDDPSWCTQIAQTDGFQAAAQSDMSTGLTASLTLPKPIDTWRVPAAAVLTKRDGHTCIVSEKKTIPVAIIASELGASLVQPISNIALNSINTVDLGSTIAGAPCS